MTSIFVSAMLLYRCLTVTFRMFKGVIIMTKNTLKKITFIAAGINFLFSTLHLIEALAGDDNDEED